MNLRNNILPLTIVGGLAAVLLLIRVTTTPSVNRDWAPEQATLPSIQYFDDDVYVRNIRNARHGAGEMQPGAVYFDRSYRVADVEKVWLVLERLSLRRAHLLVSFEFPGNHFLVFCPEPRLEKDESFSFLGGLFRQYELVYMVTSEKDAIGHRANTLNHPVILYEMPLAPAQRRALFLGMAERAKRLANYPEFYHSIFNNVTGNVMAHLRKVADRTPSGWRYWPARPERIIYKMGLLRRDQTIEILSTRGLIKDLARACQDREDFSECIRKTVGSMSEGL
jgi:hypothetical protein